MYKMSIIKEIMEGLCHHMDKALVIKLENPL